MRRKGWRNPTGRSLAEGIVDAMGGARRRKGRRNPTGRSLAEGIVDESGQGAGMGSLHASFILEPVIANIRMAFSNCPKDVAQFLTCFPNWPADSLEHRANIRAGSQWGLREVGSFKLLRQKHGPRFPGSLRNDYTEAEQLVERSEDVQAAISLLNSNWRKHNRSELLRLAGKFSSFFGLLAEVLEQPAIRSTYFYIQEYNRYAHYVNCRIIARFFCTVSILCQCSLSDSTLPHQTSCDPLKTPSSRLRIPLLRHLSLILTLSDSLPLDLRA
jgi:hypothetical protein